MLFGWLVLQDHCLWDRPLAGRYEERSGSRTARPKGFMLHQWSSNGIPESRSSSIQSLYSLYSLSYYIYIFKFIFIFKAFLTHPRLKNPRHDRGGCGQSFVPAFLPGWELLVSHFSPAMKIWMLVPKYGDISRFIWMLVPKSYGDIMRYLH